MDLCSTLELTAFLPLSPESRELLALSTPDPSSISAEQREQEVENEGEPVPNGNTGLTLALPPMQCFIFG